MCVSGSDSFYEIIKEYDRCVIDCCLVEDESPYQGKCSHEDAAPLFYVPEGKSIDHYGNQFQVGR